MNNNTQFHITDFFEAERPRDRMARMGPKSLSKAELAAILIRLGLKEENLVLITQQRYSGR